jgi:hypothetical protein
VFIGATVIDFILFRQFWKLYEPQSAKTKTIWEVKNKLRPVISLGGITAFLAGVGLMVLMHQVYGEQTWMRIKFPLVVLAITNAIILARGQNKNIDAGIQANITFSGEHRANLKTKFLTFYAIQFCLFFLIIFLSAFRFN